MSLEHFDSDLETHDLIQDLKWDEELRTRWAEHPEQVLDQYDLRPGERAALLNRDFRALYDMGVHQYLLAQLSRLYFGTDESEGTSTPATTLVQALRAGEPSVDK